MQIDRSRLNKIGIDRIVINNFKINNIYDLPRKVINSDIEYSEFLTEKNKLFNLNYSLHLKLNNDVYTVSSLEFNPNKIAEGNNVYNSSVSELMTALDKIIDIMAKNGIEIDISEARVKEIEINTTFKQKFEDLEEIVTLIGGANSKKSLGIHSYDYKKNLKKMKKDRSIYISSKLEENNRDVKGKIIKLYDKSFEIKRKKLIETDIYLSRIELLAGRDYYREYMNSIGLSNNLSDLINNNDLLKILFEKGIRQEVLIKPRQYLENILKKRLKYDFLNFRRNEKVKRIERKKLKEKGEEIPGLYKEERGVFEYLDRESWIFDYSYLLEIVSTELSPKNRDKFYRQITKKYKHKNNLETFESLLKLIGLE